MSVFAYRICKVKHQDHLFDGEGAYQHGGRWNSRGQRVVYCAGSRSLAILEILVHLDDYQILENYVMAEAEIPESCIEVLTVEDLPQDWTASPPDSAVQEVGDQWIAESRSSVLGVPSAIIPEEQNYLLNPAHADFEKIRFRKAEKFEFDARLVKALSQKKIVPKSRKSKSKKKKT